MSDLDSVIAASFGSVVTRAQPVGGGNIHDARRLDLADGRVIFAKSAGRAMAPLLEAEARGLELLAPHLRVPRVLGRGEGWLALEWLDLHPPDAAGWESLGRQLAALHAVRGDHHGLDHDNFIGSTPQLNRPAESWREFYLERRLRPQVQLAHGQGHRLDEDAILAAAEACLGDHEPAPSLLHGDLWSGNVAALADGSGVIFDPAPYFGDPETDLAMLEMFGGPLPAPFLTSYGALPPDRSRRQPLYNLYHALNHLNLFGASYLPMVGQCVARL
ncbi:fructosamine kinase family protein [Luteolibacter marinus]|uniref:fructosamine kinase family protein n=1 Tax=Luteolibacter marinus TaxID=2776705 RepID=UPI00186718FC|nr:fructosamine kinase family protein [Luteolibacter marinus]